MTEPTDLSEAIAVVGMTGRFPGAATVDDFWHNLCAGAVTVGRFDADQLAAAGVPAALATDPRYVPARGVLGAADHMDAEYFGFSAREAELTDPQHRLFLECAEEALQDAGYDSQRVGRRVGVFAGCTTSTYQFMIREFRPDIPPDDIGVRIGNDVDFLATRAAYKLNLTGPAVTVQSACSTGLVAVHLACQSLLDGECAMAVAGAASVQYPEQTGYLFEQGSICSPDGHCRPFDERARGTVSGNGVAAVVLKPLAAALRDRDPVRALIVGTAINNDGAAKIGFTAPSVRGQRAVLRMAHANAGVRPAAIGYVEAHGTGTPLGDPIEIDALSKAFGPRQGPPCVLGSVKGNIGHLDAAAGLVGLLKTVLVVEHGQIPPTAHFTTPNPDVRLADSGFEVATALRAWPDLPGPRRAGVSSFGVGGTNAHAVVQEFTAAAGEPDGSWQLAPLSARDDATLDRYRLLVADHLLTHPEVTASDASHTLQTGRRTLAHRLAVVARDSAGIAAGLSTSEGAIRGVAPQEPPRVAFLFPGQGTEFAGMAARLAAQAPSFAALLEDCVHLFDGHVPGLADFLLGEPAGGPPGGVATELAQPALFAVQYAMARLWQSWGVTPSALLGHSLGELTAATVAGVFSPADAALVVARRGQFVQSAPEGALCTVFAPADEVAPLLPDGVGVAAVNSPHATSVSGPVALVERAQLILSAAGLRTRRARSQRAFHSAELAAAADKLAGVVADCHPSAPRIPFVSGVTGDWITAEQATDPAYWAAQLRKPVRFADGVATLAADVDVLLETGHGRTLTTLARDCLPASANRVPVPGLPGGEPGAEALLRTAARLWVSGVDLDWAAVQGGAARRRLRLPTYPFRRSRYSVRPQGAVAPPAQAGGVAPDLPAHPRPELHSAYQAPRNGLERTLASVFADVLGVGEPGVDDSFFDLGGDSLVAIRVLARVHDQYGIELPGEDFFANPTIAGLADLVGSALETSVRSMDAAQVAALLGELDGGHDGD